MSSVIKLRQENADKQQLRESDYQEIESSGTAATNLIVNIFIIVVFVQGFFVIIRKQEETIT